MGPEGSLPCCQQPISFPYPAPDQSILGPPIDI